MKNLPAYYQYIVAELVCQGHYIQPTGSRVTKSGFTEGSDWDFVVLDEGWKKHIELADSGKWVLGGSGNGNSEFMSLKSITALTSSPINLIFVQDKDTFNKWVAVTDLVRKMNVKKKEDRIAIFDAIFKPSEKGLPF